MDHPGGLPDPDPMLHIETPRLVLEPLVAAHAEQLFPVLSEPDLYRYIGEDPPDDPAALAQRYRRWEVRASPDGTQRWLNWAVRPPGGSPIGYVQATVFIADASADVAYVFGLEARGRGYAREAVSAMIAHLRHVHRVQVLKATVDTRNRPSIALLEALGFTLYTVRPDAEWIHGQLTDEAQYRLAGRYPLAQPD